MSEAESLPPDSPPPSVEPPRPEATTPPAEPGPPPVKTGIARPLLTALATLVLVLAAGTIGAFGGIDRHRQKETMDAMRVIAGALESYSIDNMLYVVVNREDADASETLVRWLEPTYVKKLPTRDAWGRPFQVISDGTEYTIVSFGRDGRADEAAPAYGDSIQGPTDSRADIVFSTGSFVRFPGDVGR